MVKKLSMAIALAALLATGSAAQTAREVAQFEAAIAAAEVACAAGSEACATLMQQAIADIVASPAPAGARVSGVAAAASRVTRSLPKTESFVASIVTAAATLATDAANSIVASAPPAAAAIAVDQVSAATAEQAGQRPEICPQIATAVTEQAARAPKKLCGPRPGRIACCRKRHAGAARNSTRSHRRPSGINRHPCRHRGRRRRDRCRSCARRATRSCHSSRRGKPHLKFAQWIKVLRPPPIRRGPFALHAGGSSDPLKCSAGQST